MEKAPQTLSSFDFISRARSIHGDYYDYSLVKYINNRHKVQIICPKHGKFEQSPKSHLNGRGCQDCGKVKAQAPNNDRKLSTEEFIKKSKIIHGDRYEYSKVIYISGNDKVEIICKTHGPFKQMARDHLSGKGCSICQWPVTCAESFIDKANQIHNNFYNYDKVVYKGQKRKVIITCPIHGDFLKTPVMHLAGKICPSCARENTKKDTDELIKEFNIIHGNYDYSEMAYENYDTNIKIFCKDHGYFYKTPYNHLRGQGCSGCRPACSSIESNILELVDHLNPIKQVRNIIEPYEIDIWLPDAKLGIECHGLHWHSVNRYSLYRQQHLKNIHKIKADIADLKGIRLLQFFENEILYKNDIVKSMINNALGKSQPIYARKTTLIINANLQQFFDNNHLQGHRHASVNLALEKDGVIVAGLSLSKSKEYEWEIMRYANLAGYRVLGGFAKLLKKFKELYRPNTIMTYADRRYSVGQLYLNNNFKLIKITRPNYFYKKGFKVFARQQFQKHKLKDRLPDFDNNLTEQQNMINNGYGILYDAGHMKLLHN